MSQTGMVTLAVLAGSLISSAIECVKLYRTPGIGPEERREGVLWSLARAIAGVMIVRLVILFIS